MSFQYQFLGTVISSVLNYDQLCQSIGEPAVYNVKSTFAPCDGRSIIGSLLDRLTNNVIKNSPDLRGKFIRGLNTIYDVGQPIPFDASKYGDTQANRVVSDYQEDVVGPHSHTYTDRQEGVGNQAERGSDVGLNKIETKNTSVYSGSETRPRNIAMYYYIKIN